MKNVTILDVSYFVMNSTLSFFPYKLHETPIPVEGLKSHLLGRLHHVLHYYGTSPDRESVMYMAFDVPPLVRTFEYPDYKADRPNKTDVVMRLIEIGNDMCMGYGDATAVGVVGLEADDVIANIVRQTAIDHPGSNITIFSKDSDMMGLLETPDANVTFGWFDGTKRDRNSAPPKNVAGVAYSDILRYFALTGGHNNLPKILPPKKAKELINGGTLDAYLTLFPNIRDAYEWNLKMASPIEYNVI